MKRLLLCLVPWMAAMGAAASDTSEPAQVAYTHVGLARSGVFRIGDECFVQPETAVAWGWTVAIKGNGADIQAEGIRFDLPIRMYKDLKLIPLQAALKKLGGACAWRPDGNILDVWGVAESIEVQNGRLVVESTLAAKPRVFTLANPSRLVVDMTGVRMDDSTRLLLGPGARAAQYKPDTLRIVLDIESASGSPKYRPAPTRRFEYALTTSGSTEGVDPNQTEQMDDPPQDPIKQETTAPAAAKTTTYSSAVPAVISDKGDTLELSLVMSGAPATAPNYRRIDPITITVWLPGAKFDGNERERLRSRGIESWTVDQQGNGALYTFKLSRPMGAEFSISDREVHLILHKPEVGDGHLSGKTIVVDPGHGGHDTGARSPGKDVQEKNLTLAIAKQLSQKLAAQGATVIMTRKTDVFIPLKERSEIANRAGADLFISVHINSSRTANKTTGGITFFHGHDPVRQVLAECVQAEIAKASGLPSIGTWSDTRIYGTGFAVLRYAKMPAILVECGFINHDVDCARMVTSSFHEAMAKAIVRGVRVYLGDVKPEED